MLEYLGKGSIYIMYNKIESKEKLLQKIKMYRNIPSHDMYDYMHSLTELEFSVLNDKYINIEKRKIIMVYMYKD